MHCMILFVYLNEYPEKKYTDKNYPEKKVHRQKDPEKKYTDKKYPDIIIFCINFITVKVRQA